MTGRDFIRTSVWATLVVCALTIPLALRLGGLSTVWGVICGTALGLANLVGMAWLIRKMLFGDGTRSKGGWSVLLSIKLVGLTVIAWLMIRVFGAGPLGFVLGYSAMVTGLLIGGTRVAIVGMADDETPGE